MLRSTTLLRQLNPVFATQQLRFFAAAADDFVVVVPPIADSITEGTIEKIVKKVGDPIEQDELILVIETDKVNLEIRSPRKGVLSEVFAAEKQTVRVGENLFKIGAAGSSPAAAPAAAAPAAAAPAAAAPAKGKVSKEPVSKEAKAPEPKAAPAPVVAPAPAPAAAPAPAPAAAVRGISGLSERRVPMSRMRERIAQRLKDSQNTAAMLTTFQEVDMHNILQLREEFKDEFLKRHGVKLGLMSAFVKASTEAMKAVPAINASIDDAKKEIVYYDDVDISIAVATPKGLVTPVLRDCGKMSFADVEKEIAAYGEKARQGKITIEELSGGTFTISNGGVYGSLMGTPIINPPQSAILGMHGINKRPVAVGDQVVIRPMMYLALTYDHRLIDGREAVTFLRSVKHYVEDPRRLLLQL